MKIPYNLGQKVVDIFTKLTKQFFLWNVLQLMFGNFLRKKVKIWLLGGWLDTRHQIQVSRSATGEATRTFTFW